MLKINAATYINLGGRLESAAHVFEEGEDISQSPYGRPLTKEEQEELKALTEDMLGECEKLSLPVSSEILADRLKYSLPRNRAELDTILDVIRAELRSQVFLFVPSHLVGYYENDRLSLAARGEFKRAASEITRAGNCHAVGENTAAVFHAMRAAEICVRVLATALGVVFRAAIELQEWQTILNAITPKIRDIENQPKSEKRDRDLEFFGTAAAQLRYFKNGWRIHVSHASDLYSESEARDAIDHVKALIEILTEGGLSENP